MSTVVLPPAPSMDTIEISAQDIVNEEVRQFLEDNAEEDGVDGYEEMIEGLVQSSLEDFPEDDTTPAALYAAEMAKAYITQGTRNGHTRIIRAFILYHRKINPNWDPLAVTSQTPYDIRSFITHKCGRKEDGFEGRKFSTAVSTRAALTMWYRSIPSRRNERTTEWIQDPVTDVWHGLPTRARAVAEYMIGLEKTKARMGEVSKSARALSLDDMLRLYDHCFRDNQTHAERRWGVMRYAVYLVAFLMVLRMDEALKIAHEGVENIPGDDENTKISVGPRKTQQNGEGHSWVLCANDEMPKICPKRIFCLLADLFGPSVDPTGPLFVYVDRRGNIEPGHALTTSVVHRALMADLQALGYSSWAVYGTHSFRRGGCQYRVHHRGWNVSEIAAWGGWTQLEAVTMYRYFYSPTDNHEYMAHYDRNLPKTLN
ncbi:hypothetical protein EUX98_g3220 [Antrodiella citrinella]|uniref:Tyr recombinase domain-containing protein n=1 Tax=Antrodiella citrinella TaxID=2447956 RepID=A0A4S4MZX8_9APHY|nr:hypothetical protein EUX98_g3220 [Antrodiella citrinella]